MLEASKAIWIDNDGYWAVDSDLYGNIVVVGLESTMTLSRIVDKMRVALGYLPMFPEDESQPYDCDGWYKFYARLDNTSETGLGNTIRAIVESSAADDDYSLYDIHLTEDEQVDVYNELDRQLRERFGTSCEALLAGLNNILLERKLFNMTKYPMEVNGWHWSLDADSMSYWKDFNDGHSEAVALCWLDTVEGDEGYNSEGDCYVLIEAEGRNEEEALNNLYDTTIYWGDVMRRKEAEKELIEYMETH